MKILIIGKGGREHALAWHAAQFADTKVYVAPGNAGTALEKHVENIKINENQVSDLIYFSIKNDIDIVIPGSETMLAKGIVDDFSNAGISIFGPNKAAAQLESSKTFCKKFMMRHGIPTALYKDFTDANAAIQYINEREMPVVVKADGLAAGKGVSVCFNRNQAKEFIEKILYEKEFGDAGCTIIIEDYLEGEEVSFICMTDGKNIIPLATSQDHKALLDDDHGPNTGGMGAYSPAPIITDELHEEIMSTIIRPAVCGMEDEGTPYVGFLYAGLMISESGRPKVLEFNCRLGDPETQPIMMRLKSNLPLLCIMALEGKLGEINVQWDHRAALGVVMASFGYPDAYDIGHKIYGIYDNNYYDDCKIFHAGTSFYVNRDYIINSGGRVLCITALGDTIDDAQRKAYERVEKVYWKDCSYRKDIGNKSRRHMKI